MTEDDNSAEMARQGIPHAEEINGIVQLKHQLRQILHRMNNDLTAVTLAFDCANEEISNHSNGESSANRLNVLTELVSNLSRDLREMTHLCRPGSPDEKM